jgi:hypothetical protein
LTQQISHSVQWGALLNQARSEVMAQIVPMELRDPCAREKVRAGLPESSRNPKTLAPAGESIDEFVLVRMR